MGHFLPKMGAGSGPADTQPEANVISTWSQISSTSIMSLRQPWDQGSVATERGALREDLLAVLTGLTSAMNIAQAL